jgi:hypothetical protein
MGSGLTPVQLPSIPSALVLGAYALEEPDHGSGPELYAGGQFEDGSAVRHGMARWDGAQWSLFDPGTETVAALASLDDGSGAHLYVGSQGSTDPLRTWDGASFASVPLSPVASNVYALATYDRGPGPELYAAGAFPDVLQGAGVVRANGVARRDGAGWHALGSSASDLEGNVEDCQVWDDGQGTALFAAGRFERAGDQALARIARWDGATWSSLGSGLDGAVYDLALHDEGAGEALFAGGAFASAGGLAANYVARWDGQQWSALGAGPGGLVRVMASFDDGSGPALYAGGGALPVTRWDGTAWAPVGLNPPDARSMAVHDDGSGAALYVGFGQAKQGTSGDVWKWDGSSWSSIGPSDSRVGSLYSYDDGSGPALYAGGGFSVIGGTVVSHLARWDGAQWEQVGAPFFIARVKSWSVYDDGSGERLVAGSGYVAAWDGTAWSWLTSGLAPGPVGSLVALEPFGTRLFVGRDDHPGLDWWGPTCECAPVSYCTAGTSASGCQATLTAAGGASASASSGFSVAAATVEGQKDGLFFYGQGGRQANPWGNGSSFQCVVPPVRRGNLLSGTERPLVLGLPEAEPCSDAGLQAPGPALVPGPLQYQQPDHLLLGRARGRRLSVIGGVPDRTPGVRPRTR